MLVYYDQRLVHPTLSLFKRWPPSRRPTGQGPFYCAPKRCAASWGLEKTRVGSIQVFNALHRTTTRRSDTSAALPLDLARGRGPDGSESGVHVASVSQYRMGRGLLDDDGISGTTRREIDSQPPITHSSWSSAEPPMFSLERAVHGRTTSTSPRTNFVVDRDGKNWSFQYVSRRASVFYATWTTTGDVRAAIVPNTGTWSMVQVHAARLVTNIGDGTSSSILDFDRRLRCAKNAFTGSRNQYIYLSRSRRDARRLAAGAKALFAAPKQRAFIVTVQNLSAQDRVITMICPARARGVSAPSSGLIRALADGHPVGSHIGHRPGGVASLSNPAGRCTVNVTETASLQASAWASSVILNRGSVSPLAQPGRISDGVGMSRSTPRPSRSETRTKPIRQPTNHEPYMKTSRFRA
jgi:hypothetical protein